MRRHRKNSSRKHEPGNRHVDKAATGQHDFHDDQPQPRTDQESDTSAEHYAHDATLLDVARTRWQLCDWERLVQLKSDYLLHHPDRAKLALLVASANFQRSNFHQAQRFLQLALDWGASRRQAAQVLIAGTHYCLAAARKILGDNNASLHHAFESLKSSGVPGDSELLAEIRATRLHSILE